MLEEPLAEFLHESGVSYVVLGLELIRQSTALRREAGIAQAEEIHLADPIGMRVGGAAFVPKLVPAMPGAAR